MSKKTWEVRIEGAAAAFNMTPADFEAVFVKTMGISKENVADLDDDKLFKFGEFRASYETCLPIPIRKAWEALIDRDPEAKPGTTGGNDRLEALKALGFKTKLEDADPELILPHYLPGKPNDAVTLALKKRFGTEPVILFREDGSVAIPETLAYVDDLEHGMPASETYVVDGKLARIWPVGVKPEIMVEEDPLCPGRPLRHGYSTVNNRNWSKVTFTARQMCRIILDRGEIDPANKEAVLRLWDRANTSVEALNEVYQEAELEFRERKKKDTLPKLMVELGTIAKSNSPFLGHKSY